MVLLEANLSCNFFRASFDVAMYSAFVEEVISHLERPPSPSPTLSPASSPARLSPGQAGQSPVGSPSGVKAARLGGSPSGRPVASRWKEN